MPPLIAVVDDDADFLALMDDVLVDAGYRFARYPSLTDILPRLRREPPALLVLDIRIGTPEGGSDLLTVLRHDPDLRHVPVVVCSADATFLHAHGDALRAHGFAILPKPFDLDDLLATLDVALRGAHGPTLPGETSPR